ncbi:MAG TPA: metal-dependent hydrolase [Acidimicrobiia bacterium]|nr:metal-dependent hydrolase [Acidimicrobiia bacterium]
MVLWHLGVTTLLVRYVFRDPRMDLRWVLVGSLLPDLVDKPIGSVLFNEQLGSDRLVAHAVVFPVVAMFVVLVATPRGSALRKGLIGVVIGALFHLVLDGAWADPEAFWWPFFGLGFPLRPDSAIGPLLGRMVADPLVWVGEAVGLAYLVVLWRTHLSEPGSVRGFLRDGRIPMPAAGSSR